MASDARSKFRIDSWSSELVVRQSLASKDINTETEESTLLGAVT
jgi:hypothetical protein